jgi:hypothetical protein
MTTRTCLIIPLFLSIVLLVGCVQRTIRVTSEPEGARVWLNDVEVGRTPVEVSFTFYGEYDVRAEHPGYEPYSGSREAKAPLWQYPVVDLVAEAIPADFEDVVEWHVVLEPRLDAGMDRDEAERSLLERAREMRAMTSGDAEPDSAE